MLKARSRVAVGPLRRPVITPIPLTSVDALVEELRPVEPMVAIRPRTLRRTAERFVTTFPGDVLYAVKCNPEPTVLRALWRGGVRHFDCASLGEIRVVRSLFADAQIHYMHPIKQAAAIREAYETFGVRDFSVDSAEEIEKIVAATNGARDLGIYVRLAMPKGQTVYDLSGKFGAPAAEMPALLRQARAAAKVLGLCFHVGSQCMDPGVYERALELAGRVIAEAGVQVDGIDVGGGFPVSYPDVTPPALGAYFEAIQRGFARLGLAQGTRLWCEPGRALVAAGASLVVQVEARRGDVLYINDGIYGNLSDAGVPKWRFPARLVRKADGSAVEASAETTGFAFYGPTCDSADFMQGPFFLPSDVKTGDWIELGQLGAYGACLRTAFNGFDRVLLTEVRDEPLLTTPGHLDGSDAIVGQPADRTVQA
ncbi:ornithine decarboxylase [Aliidongia dinghuensis]|uniref:ornithine decarboxylase n=1 Tax=Aliidongia dinghuensis TaxID=1867774 RepID=A0A8J3E387_9PROT|nr:type III PLP-dependent enzyme [Aliidongia dinghuensis]GGF17105.1 ornithine decarboxylase [Aliidongia dinghuensis]